MKEFQKLRKELAKIGGNIILACSPGYDYYFEEFSKNIWRINIIVDMSKLSIDKILKIREIVEEIYSDYNLIICAGRQKALEYWHGEAKNKNILLNIVPFSSMTEGNLWEIPPLIKKEVVSGKDFTQHITARRYDWIDFSKVAYHLFVVNYIYLKDDLSEELRIGMLKSYFFRTVASAIYCKGRMPSNKEKILSFVSEKFNDKKMELIVKLFYDNLYFNLEEAIRDTIYFMNKLFYWPGLNFYSHE